MKVKVCLKSRERFFFFPFCSVPAALDPCSLPSLIHIIQSLFQSLHQKKEPKGLSPPLYLEESSDKEAGTSARENQDAYQWLFEMCALILLIAGDNGYPCMLRLPFHAGYRDGNNHSLIDSCPSWGQTFFLSDEENHFTSIHTCPYK